MDAIEKSACEEQVKRDPTMDADAVGAIEKTVDADAVNHAVDSIDKRVWSCDKSKLCQRFCRDVFPAYGAKVGKRMFGDVTTWKFDQDNPDMLMAENVFHEGRTVQARMGEVEQPDALWVEIPCLDTSSMAWQNAGEEARNCCAVDAHDSKRTGTVLQALLKLLR